jgi:transposase
MYVDKIPNRNSPPAYLVRESYREDGKVKKRTIANVSFLNPEQLASFRALLKGATVSTHQTNFEDAFDLLSTTPHGHISAVLGTMEKLRLPGLLARSDSPERRATLALIAGRIISPGSKLALSAHLSGKSTTLADELSLPESLTEDDLYRAMRWLGERQERIQKSLAKRHLSEGTLILYDLSSSYYEGSTCSLATYGHNRDQKKGKKQINYGLLTDRDGRPISIEVYPGNTSDPNTVADQLRRVRQTFGIKKAIIVGDRGMLTSKQLDLAAADPQLADYGWISALRSSQIHKLVQTEDLQLDLFDQRDLAEITSEDFPDERLVVCRNPALARKRHHTRQDLIKATEVILEKIRLATLREKNPYHGKDKIARRVEREGSRYHMLKHFKLTFTETRFTFARDEQNITREARLDGLYIIRARNIEEDEMVSSELVSTYKSLAKVESAFRRLKTTALLVRPIFHYDSDMVKAHIFLCMLAYYVQWEMEHQLAPLLFREEDPAAAEALRESPVAPAQRSESAEKKEKSKRTADGVHPVQSFRSLLENLATLTRATCRPKVEGAGSFIKYPQATALQQEAYRLLDLNLQGV